MSESIFKSNMADKIESFIKFKRSQGYKYDKTPIYTLRYFDEYCLTHGNSNECSEQIVTGFITYFQEKRNFKKCDFISTLREMGSYLHAVGDSSAYIPGKEFQTKRHVKDIYVMSEEEVIAFFSEMDKYYYENRNNQRTCHLGRNLVYPAYFRLLHSMGVRTFEARWLKTDDVNFVQKCIDIMNSKGNRDRRLYIRDDLADYLSQYFEQITRIFPEAEWFFPSVGGMKCESASSFAAFFNKIWRRTPFYIEGARHPTPYSLRHHFATANIIRWASNGEDVHAHLPYLMRAMGHSEIESTYYYVHLVQEHYGMIKDKCSELEDLFPEVIKHDEDY